MKKVLFAGLVLVLFSAVSASAGIIDLTTANLIGTVTPGLPSGETQEDTFVSSLIDMYNGVITDDPYTVTFTPHENSLTLNGSADDFGTLPGIAGDGVKDEVSPFMSVEGYLYLYAKFGQGNTGAGQWSELYYLGGDAPDIGDLNSSLSHVTYFNATTVPEPSLIMLLGLGLGAVGLVPRRKK